MTKILKVTLLFLALITQITGCFNNERVVISPYVLILNPTEGFLPTSTNSIFKELDLMLPTVMRNAISIAYLKALSSRFNEGEEFFEKYIFILLDEVSKFSPTEVGTYLEFRNELVAIWALSKRNNFTIPFYKKGIDEQSIVSVIIQAYGAYLNNIAFDIDKLIAKEIQSDENWNEWKKNNLD